MAIAVTSTSCYGLLNSTVKLRLAAVHCQRRLATLRSPRAEAPANNNHLPQRKRGLKKESLSSNTQIEGVSQKKYSGRSKETDSSSGKPFGTLRKDRKDSQFDLSEQQDEAENIHEAVLNAVVKVYCTHSAPDPWPKQRQFTSTGRQVFKSLLAIAVDEFKKKKKIVSYES